MEPTVPDRSKILTNPMVVYGVNSAYILPALVSIYSLQKNASRPVDVTLYLQAEDLEPHDLDLIDQARDRIGLNIQHKIFPGSVYFEGYEKLNSRHPVITLLPLVLPRLTEGRILFLDADTLVVSDVMALLDLDMAGYPVAACPGFGRMANAVPSPPGEPVSNRIKQLGFVPGGGNYFNSGVLVMDCPRIRQLPNWQSLCDVERLRPFAGAPGSGDQDRLNQFFHDNWHPAPVKWNTPSGVKRWVAMNHRNYRQAPDGLQWQMQEAARSPMIWHYMGKKKPWKGAGKSVLLRLTRRAFSDYFKTLSEFNANLS